MILRPTDWLMVCEYGRTILSFKATVYVTEECSSRSGTVTCGFKRILRVIDDN